MTRSNRSAKAAGSKTERDTADYLAEHIDDRIDRRVKTGAKDRGDIGGVRLSPALRGGKVVIECKNVAPPKSAPTFEQLLDLVADGPFTGTAIRRIMDAYKPALRQKLALGPWLNEAAIERGNDDAVAGVVVFKRHGYANPAKLIVAMELADLVALLTGERPPEL